MGEILGVLETVKAEFQTIVVTGRHQKKRRELAALDRKLSAHAFGFVTNMHELWPCLSC